MKISIKAAIALKTKALTGGLSLLFLLGGCHKKVNYFNWGDHNRERYSGKRHADRGTAAAGQYRHRNAFALRHDLILYGTQDSRLSLLLF